MGKLKYEVTTANWISEISKEHFEHLKKIKSRCRACEAGIPISLIK